MTARDPETTAIEQPSGWTSRRLALLAGPAMGVAFVGGTILAGVLAPSVQWTEHGFGELGDLLHGSILLGSLLGVVFLRRVWDDADHIVQRVGTGLIAIALLMMATVNAVDLLVAQFPEPAGILGILGFMFGMPVAILVHSLGDVVTGLRRRGLASLVLGLGYCGGLWYGFQTREITVLLGFVWLALISAWALVQYMSLRGDRISM